MHIKAGNLLSAYIDTQMCEIEVEDLVNGAEYYENQDVDALPRASRPLPLPPYPRVVFHTSDTTKT